MIAKVPVRLAIDCRFKHALDTAEISVPKANASCMEATLEAELFARDNMAAEPWSQERRTGFACTRWAQPGFNLAKT